MKVVFKKENKYILRFDWGEEVICALINFCQKENIKAGHFFGLGAAQEVLLSSYDLAEKKYKNKLLKEEIEIAGLVGNISLLKSKTTIHAHGTFSDKNFCTYAGHVKKLLVSATCEVVLERLKGKVERSFNKKTGLNLLI